MRAGTWSVHAENILPLIYRKTASERPVNRYGDSVIVMNEAVLFLQDNEGGTALVFPRQRGFSLWIGDMRPLHDGCCHDAGDFLYPGAAQKKTSPAGNVCRAAAGSGVRWVPPGNVRLC